MKRLLALITNSARLIAENEAIKNQALQATKAASSLIDAANKKEADSEKSRERKKSESNQEIVELLRTKSEELNELKQTLKSKLVDLDVMKKQSENLAKEYDNLLNEHAKITAKLEKYEAEGSSGENSKKSN